MVEKVILPQLGQTMEEGTIIEWLKQEGDQIQRGETLFTMESDKATLEVEAPSEGFLRRILVPEGGTAPVLTVVGLITETADEDISGYEAQETAGEQRGRGVEEQVSAPASQRPSSLARAERIFASPRARRVAREEGVDLADVTGTGPNSRIVEQDVLDYLESVPEATPVARRLAEHEELDLRAVTGTGPGERITKADVERALGAAEEAAAPPEPEEEVETIAEVPMRGVRARIAQRMHESHRTTAPVTLTTEADATAFVRMRERLRESLVDQLGFDLGYNDLLIKLTARALREFPYMNARLERDEDADLTEGVIHRLDEVHVALAVDTEQGLLTPVVRDADERRITRIAREVRELIERARSGEALPDDLSGSTFTITNLGMYDVDAFTPIINPPEAALLGVGRIKAQPVAVDGEVCVRQMVWLSLTFDHRLVDGAPAARFLRRVKQLIEEPYLMFA